MSNKQRKVLGANHCLVDEANSSNIGMRSEMEITSDNM